MSDPAPTDKAAPDCSPEHATEKRSNPWAKVGIGLILLSGVLWFSLFAIPFLPLSAGRKVLLAGIVFAGVQVAWWGGAALAGPKVVGTIRSWFRTRRRQTDSELSRDTD